VTPADDSRGGGLFVLRDPLLAIAEWVRKVSGRGIMIWQPQILPDERNEAFAIEQLCCVN
jgi:hypothetical protein